MSGLARFVAPILEILQVKLEIFVEIRFDSLFELRLVVLNANHEIAIPFDDVMSALFLAARGIDRGQRVGKLDPLQELENRRDFVRFLFGRDLAQGDPLLAGPGSDDVQRTQLLLRVCYPRHVLPTMAISRSGPLSWFRMAWAIQSWKHF
jgi:hypothetical protein